jgi:predicted adenine nucleotide alpha hydrolase (AANH) superfamily ATPase
MVMNEPLLLHTCCGPCATGSIPAWRAEGLEPVALFCNPNVQPAAEYRRRLSAAGQMATALQVRLEVAELPVSAVHPWLPAACATGDPPAAPGRCRLCVGGRLRLAAQWCAELGLRRFATTLAISPYQAQSIIREEGEAAAAAYGVEFLYADQRRFYARSREESRRLGLYRQPYCGCVASKWEAWRPPRRPRSTA